MTVRAEPRSPSPVVLRLLPHAHLWTSSARLAGDDAPFAVRALLAGRNRLELSAGEAETTVEWARRVPGWESEGAPALAVYALDASRATGGR